MATGLCIFTYIFMSSIGCSDHSDHSVDSCERYGNLIKMTFYDILWHMSYDIRFMKYVNMGIKRSVSIRCINTNTLKPFLKQF